MKSATVVIGDVNTARGEALIKELRESTGNEKYIYSIVLDFDARRADVYLPLSC